MNDFSWIRPLASLRLTLASLLLVAAGSLATTFDLVAPFPALVGPLGLAAINLLAAIAVHAELRSRSGLLIFHLALLVVILLIGLSRMTYLKGWVEVTQGQPFEGQLQMVEQGPWHNGDLVQVRFANEGFTVQYYAGLRRGPTANRVRWLDEAGTEQFGVIGDGKPLVIRGYRFATTANKGFAAMFTWLPADGGPAQRGNVNLAGYPMTELPSNDWTIPGSQQTVLTMLTFDSPMLNPDGPWTLRLPEAHHLVVTVSSPSGTTGSVSQDMRPGEAWSLPEGRLQYDGLVQWMGYQVFYDWTMPWLVVSVLVGVAGLFHHVMNKVWP